MKICFVLFALLLFGKAGAQSIDTDRVRPLGSNKIIVDKLKVQTIVTASDTLRLQPGIDTAEAIKYLASKSNPYFTTFSFSKGKFFNHIKVFSIRNHMLRYRLVTDKAGDDDLRSVWIILLIVAIFPLLILSLDIKKSRYFLALLIPLGMLMIMGSMSVRLESSIAYQLNWVDRYSICFLLAIIPFLSFALYLIKENVISKKKKAITVL